MCHSYIGRAIARGGGGGGGGAETPTLRILPYFLTETAGVQKWGIFRSYMELAILTSHLIDLLWHPASYFVPNSPPAATSARMICMGVGLHLQKRGGAAHAL